MNKNKAASEHVNTEYVKPKNKNKTASDMWTRNM